PSSPAIADATASPALCGAAACSGGASASSLAFYFGSAARGKMISTSIERRRAGRARAPALVHPDPVIRVLARDLLERGVEASGVLHRVALAVAGAHGFDARQDDDLVSRRSALPYEDKGSD